MTAPAEKYPGHVREFGVALAYQRFWWKGAYTALHAMNTTQKYLDEENDRIQNGCQLFLTFRLGYHVSLFKNRLFIEPSIAFTHWPVNTYVPVSFAVQEKKWPIYFRWEPDLHFGVKF